jgi:catabolite regulation protein CreA
MWDAQKRTLAYLVWSTQALSPGCSPFTSVTAVRVARDRSFLTSANSDFRR